MSPFLVRQINKHYGQKPRQNVVFIKSSRFNGKGLLGQTFFGTGFRELLANDWIPGNDPCCTFD
jgi:hypothetical protein